MFLPEQTMIHCAFMSALPQRQQHYLPYIFSTFRMNCNWLCQVLTPSEEKITIRYTLLMHKYGQNAQEIAMGWKNGNVLISQTRRPQHRPQDGGGVGPCPHRTQLTTGHGDLRVAGGRVPDEAPS